jgi:hypothetical protein
MRYALLILAMAAPALAQTWTPDTGWDTGALQRQHDEAVSDMHRRHEEATRKMDEDFDRSSRNMMLAFGAMVVAMMVAAVIASAAKRRRQLVWTPELEVPPMPIVAATPAGNVDVSVLRIAIDGRASKFVQTELERITKQFESTSGEGRAKQLREVSLTLRRVRDAWLYGGAVNEPMRPLGNAKAAFAKHADDARLRFKGDLPPATATGPSRSLILVTIVVAARGELATVTEIGAGDDLRRALETAGHRDPADLIALEVTWFPAEAGRTLSSIELEAAYPRPDLVPLHGALAGMVFCTYCTGPFPGELVSCPHCGAPAHGRPRAA